MDRREGFSGHLVGDLLQGAANRIDAQYQSKPGEERKGREPLQVQCLFGTFLLQRDYYYHPGKKQGHFPADAALGLEGGNTPALARLVCLEGADEASYQKAENHLLETGGIPPDLETLVAEHPLREGPKAQLMLALYRSGRQAEALEAYREARRVLDDELGLEPGPPLRELEQAILRHDASLHAEAPARAQPSRRTVTRRARV
jgi:hypothetical protein